MLVRLNHFHWPYYHEVLLTVSLEWQVQRIEHSTLADLSVMQAKSFHHTHLLDVSVSWMLHCAKPSPSIFSEIATLWNSWCSPSYSTAPQTSGLNSPCHKTKHSSIALSGNNKKKTSDNSSFGDRMTHALPVFKIWKKEIQRFLAWPSKSKLWKWS